MLVQNEHVLEDHELMGVAYQLLGILQKFAPTGDDQQRCSDLYNNLQGMGVTPKELVKAMTLSLADGLQFGNWVWLVNNTNRLNLAPNPTEARPSKGKFHNYTTEEK